MRARLLARGGAAARGLLALLAGDALVEELAEFLELFVSLRPGFQARALAVQEQLRSEESAFVLVTSALADNLADAAYLRDGLAARGVGVRGLIVNRAYIEVGEAGSVDDAGIVSALEPASAEASAGFAAVLEHLNAVRHRVIEGNRRAEQAIEAFASGIARGCLQVWVPSLDHEPQDLRALMALAERLAG